MDENRTSRREILHGRIGILQLAIRSSVIADKLREHGSLDIVSDGKVQFVMMSKASHEHLIQRYQDPQITVSAGTFRLSSILADHCSTDYSPSSSIMITRLFTSARQIADMLRESCSIDVKVNSKAQFVIMAKDKHDELLAISISPIIVTKDGSSRPREILIEHCVNAR